MNKGIFVFFIGTVFFVGNALAKKQPISLQKQLAEKARVLAQVRKDILTNKVVGKLKRGSSDCETHCFGDNTFGQFLKI